MFRCLRLKTCAWNDHLDILIFRKHFYKGNNLRVTEREREHMLRTMTQVSRLKFIICFWMNAPGGWPFSTPGPRIWRAGVPSPGWTAWLKAGAALELYMLHLQLDYTCSSCFFFKLQVSDIGSDKRVQDAWNCTAYMQCILFALYDIIPAKRFQKYAHRQYMGIHSWIIKPQAQMVLGHSWTSDASVTSIVLHLVQWCAPEIWVSLARSMRKKFMLFWRFGKPWLFQFLDWINSCSHQYSCQSDARVKMETSLADGSVPGSYPT